MTHLNAVQEIYSAFGTGDIPGVLAKLSETVEWEYGAVSTDVPWLQRRKGLDGAAAFFSSLQAIEIHSFRVKTLLEGDGVVVALIDIELTVKSTGKRIAEEDEVHIWHFDDRGKVARFCHRLNTHQHHLAYHG